MATKCVVFKRKEKGGRALAKANQREVCFKRKEATTAQKKAKAARAKRILRDFACKSAKSPAAACAVVAPSSRQMRLLGMRSR